MCPFVVSAASRAVELAEIARGQRGISVLCQPLLPHKQNAADSDRQAWVDLDEVCVMAADFGPMSANRCSGFDGGLLRCD